MSTLKVNYSMCRKCREENEKRFGWSDISEYWATHETNTGPPHICCPGNIISKYHNRVVKKFESLLSTDEKRHISVDNPLYVHNVHFIDSDKVPCWCLNLITKERE